MKDLCKDVNFDCSEKGLQVQSMDSSHVALVSLLLRESAFADFKCDRPTSLGMNVDSLGKIFKMCGPNDSLKLRWQNDADTLNFRHVYPRQQFGYGAMPHGGFGTAHHFWGG